MISLNLRVAVLWGMAVAMLARCSLVSTSIPSPTVNNLTGEPTNEWPILPTEEYYFVPTSNSSEYTHYSPPQNSRIRLEFDFPSDWLFSENVSYAFISLRDPRFLILPTPFPNEFPHPVPNDFGDVDIWIISSKPERTVESETEDQKTSYRAVGWATFLNDYKVGIDGFGARVIEHQIQMPDLHTSMMFERQLYFFAENEIYRIRFLVAEKERGGKFEQGYEHFFKSLKIIRQK